MSEAGLMQKSFEIVVHVCLGGFIPEILVIKALHHVRSVVYGVKSGSLHIQQTAWVPAISSVFLPARLLPLALAFKLKLYIVVPQIASCSNNNNNKAKKQKKKQFYS